MRIDDPKAEGGYRLIRQAWLVKWWAIQRALAWRDLDVMLGGVGRYAVMRMEQASFVGIDVDAHDQPPKRWLSKKRAGLPFFESRRERKAWERKAAEEWRRELLGPVLRKLVDAAEAAGIATLVERTPRGFHVLAFFREPVAVAEARNVGLAWVRRAGVTKPGGGIGVEVFPKVHGDGLGETFSLPLSAGHRVVEAPNDDGVVWGVPKYQTRDRDMGDLLAVRPAALEVFRAGFGVLDRLEFEEAERVDRARASDGLGYEVLFGADFVIAVLDRLERGLDRGQAYDQFRPVVAACAYAGMDRDAMLAAMEAWLRKDIHRAKHCESSGGIRQMLSVARCCYRHFESGVHHERCYWNGMNAPELRAELAALAGVEPIAYDRRAARAARSARQAA